MFCLYCLSFILLLQPIYWHFACLQMSTLWLFISLLEHYQCFPHEDVCPIFILGSVSRNIVPRAIFPNTLPREQWVYFIMWSFEIILFAIVPVASEYQEIHLYSATNIESVKINTSVIMTRECILHVSEERQQGSKSKWPCYRIVWTSRPCFFATCATAVSASTLSIESSHCPPLIPIIADHFHHHIVIFVPQYVQNQKQYWPSMCFSEYTHDYVCHRNI